MLKHVELSQAQLAEGPIQVPGKGGAGKAEAGSNVGHVSSQRGDLSSKTEI